MLSILVYIDQRSLYQNDLLCFNKSAGNLIIVNKMVKFNSLCCILFIIQFSVSAQETKKSEFSKAIEDNSFFIEEAYNQEYRVVQHINNLKYSLDPSHDFEYSFTQEWPVVSQKHQFSYTLGFSSLNAGDVKGLNDILLNYRYQLTGHDDFVDMAPRFSLIIPTGNSTKGLGNGVVGYQFDLPLSKRVTNSLAIHANIGYTLLPSVKSIDLYNITHKNNLSIINFGASAIWLVTYKTNLMLEALYNISKEVTGNIKLINTGQTIISPGIRHAIEIKNLEIVPGFALPVTIQNGKAGLAAFLYLSFEHPF